MNTFWESNLGALRQRPDRGCRDLAARLEESGPGPGGLRTRSGTEVPFVVAGGAPRALGSLYDPQKEASRWAEELPGGTLAVWGAMGTAVVQALAQRGLALVFTVEPRLELWRSLFTWEDWKPWLEGEFWVPIAGTPSEWDLALRERYHPLWDGAFQTREWRASVQGAEELWSPYRSATVRALEAIAADASTQARFGERWYRNTLVNLRRLEAAEVSACPGATVVVAGAGPGLEDALTLPANQKWLDARPQSGDRLFATDTSVPALKARGIVPDLILCLDGQLPTYHHFVAPPPRVPLVADIASIPLLGRLGLPVVRFLSGHPLGLILRRWFPELPVLDGSLGQVSGLALMTARALGAARVETWGVDFAYRLGQSYARGTYVYDLAYRQAHRLQPGETRLTSACYGASGLERTFDSQGRAWDTTPLLRDYRQRWTTPPPVRPVRLAHGGAQERWDAFVSDWRRRLEALPLPPDGPFHAFVRTLVPEVRQDWWALWPLALSLHRQGTDVVNRPQTIIDRALSFLED